MFLARRPHSEPMEETRDGEQVRNELGKNRRAKETGYWPPWVRHFQSLFRLQRSNRDDFTHDECHVPGDHLARKCNSIIERGIDSMYSRDALKPRAAQPCYLIHFGYLSAWR